MSRYSILIFYSLASVLAFLISISTLGHYFPQIIALATIICIYFSLHQQKLPLLMVIFMINLIVFSTHGVNSPVYFLLHFLLLIIAFQNPPIITISYSTVLILLFSQSLNSFTSIIPLFSLILIAPLAWLVGQQQLENFFLNDTVSRDETDVYLWLSLQFKKSMSQIVDSASILLSDPKLNQTQKANLNKIKNLSHDLLSSSQKLSQKVEDNDKT